MGTYVARFKVFSQTDSPTFQPAPPSDFPDYFIAFATGDFITNYILYGNCFFLDGSLVPIAFSGLPNGFTITSSPSLRITNSDNRLGFLEMANAAIDVAKSTITFGIYGPTVTNCPNDGLVHPLSQPFIPATASPIDLLAILSIEISLTLIQAFDLGLQGGVYQNLEIFGNYGLPYSWSLTPNTPVAPGTTVTITDNTPTPVIAGTKQINVVYQDVSGNLLVSIPIFDFILILPNIVTFKAPNICDFIKKHFPKYYPLFCVKGGKVLTQIYLLGNGVQFSGSVLAGTLQILYANASGLYVLTSGKTADTLYGDNAGGVRFGSATFVSNFIDLEDDLYEDIIINPTLLTTQGLPPDDQDVEDNDIMLFDNTVPVPITFTTFTPVTTDVAIPNPFIKTAFV